MLLYEFRSLLQLQLLLRELSGLSNAWLSVKPHPRLLLLIHRRWLVTVTRRHGRGSQLKFNIIRFHMYSPSGDNINSEMCVQNNKTNSKLIIGSKKALTAVE